MLPLNCLKKTKHSAMVSRSFFIWSTSLSSRKATCSFFELPVGLLDVVQQSSTPGACGQEQKFRRPCNMPGLHVNGDGSCWSTRCLQASMLSW